MRQIAISTVAVFAIGLVLWQLFGGGFAALNFALAGVASSLVIAASFMGYAKVIKNSDITPSEPLSEEDEEEDEKITAKTAVAQTYKGWFFPFRLAAYVVLVLCFLGLNAKNLLLIAPFLTGLAVVPFSVMIQWYYFKKVENEKVDN